MAFSGALKAAYRGEDLRAEPVGRYLVDETFVSFYPERGCNGFSLWGRPGADDVRRLNRLNDAVLSPQGGRHVSLVDLRGLEGVDPAAFATMAAYLSARWQPFRELVVRQALVRPAGLVGAVVAGFYDVLRPSFPVAVFGGAALAGDESLTSIALEVGCASAQHFGARFRKVTGQSPSAWRARVQGARPAYRPGRAAA